MSYMNELARLNSVPGSWQLCKSSANWGQVQVLLSCSSQASVLPDVCCMLCMLPHSVLYCLLHAFEPFWFQKVHTCASLTGLNQQNCLAA